MCMIFFSYYNIYKINDYGKEKMVSKSKGKYLHNKYVMHMFLFTYVHVISRFLPLLFFNFEINN